MLAWCVRAWAGGIARTTKETEKQPNRPFPVWAISGRHTRWLGPCVRGIVLNIGEWPRTLTWGRGLCHVFSDFALATFLMVPFCFTKEGHRHRKTQSFLHIMQLYQNLNTSRDGFPTHMLSHCVHGLSNDIQLTRS